MAGLVLAAPAAAQTIVSPKGTPFVGQVSTTRIHSALDRLEVRGFDVSKPREMMGRIDSRGVIRFETFDPMDLAHPKDIREATYRVHQAKGLPQPLLNAERRHEVDMTLPDYAAAQGFGDPDMVRKIMSQEQRPDPALLRFLHRKGFDPVELKALDTPERAESVAQQLRSAGAPERGINALRGP